MPKYRVTLMKDWVITDEAVVEVDASTKSDAAEIAWELAGDDDVEWLSGADEGSLQNQREEVELIEE